MSTDPRFCRPDQELGTLAQVLRAGENPEKFNQRASLRDADIRKPEEEMDEISRRLSSGDYGPAQNTG